MRYWIYKNNAADGGPSGYWGLWECNFFTQPGPARWGGTEASRSAEVHRYLDEEIATGDVMACYQTDAKAVVGFAVVHELTGPVGARALTLQPIHLLDEPFQVHKHKHGTVLEKDPAVNGQPAIRELGKAQMEEIVRLSGAPTAVLRGQPGPSGWVPAEPCQMAFSFEDAAGGVEVEVRWWDDPLVYAVREVTRNGRGDRSEVTVRAEVRTVADAIAESEPDLTRIGKSAEGLVGWILTGYDEEAWVWLADDGGFVVGRGDDADHEEIGYGATIVEALQDVASLIEQTAGV